MSPILYGGLSNPNTTGQWPQSAHLMSYVKVMVKVSLLVVVPTNFAAIVLIMTLPIFSKASLMGQQLILLLVNAVHRNENGYLKPGV